MSRTVRNLGAQKYSTRISNSIYCIHEIIVSFVTFNRAVFAIQGWIYVHLVWFNWRSFMPLVKNFPHNKFHRIDWLCLFHSVEIRTNGTINENKKWIWTTEEYLYCKKVLSVFYFSCWVNIAQFVQSMELRKKEYAYSFMKQYRMDLNHDV